MATYDITGHELLSAKAKSLSPEVFDANVIAGEMLHDLYGTNYTDDDLKIVELILVYQVNFQVENDQNSELYERIVEGERDYAFREGAPPVSSTAQALRAKLDQSDQETAQAQNAKKQVASSSRSKGNSVVW